MSAPPRSRPARRVLIVLYGNPATYPPLVRAARILQERGCAVRLVGTYGQQTDGLDVRQIDSLDLRLVRRGEGRTQVKVAYFVFLARALWQIAFWRPSWVYASDCYATPIAWLAVVTGVRTLYHEHDIPEVRRPSRLLRAILAVRRAVLKRASTVVVPSEGRAAAIEALRDGRGTMVVWNCPSRGEIREHASAVARSSLRVAYQGSVVPARLPVTVIEAIAAVGGDVCLTIIGYETSGAPGYVRSLLDRASALGIGDRVVYLGRVSTDRKLDVAAESDLGLALMPTASGDANERTMAGASNKPFEYLGCGTPLLVSDLPDWRELFVARGVALACDPSDAGSIASAFEWALSNREALAAMGRQGHTLVAEGWNYEARFEPVADVILGTIPAAGARRR